MGKAQQGMSVLELPSGVDRKKNADFQVLSRLDPSNRQIKSLLQLSTQVGSFLSGIGLISPVLSPTLSQPGIEHPWRYGTESLHTPLGITSEHGCSFRRFTVISPNGMSSPPSTFTLAKIKNTGIEPWISLTG